MSRDANDPSRSQQSGAAVCCFGARRRRRGRRLRGVPHRVTPVRGGLAYPASRRRSPRRRWLGRCRTRICVCGMRSRGARGDGRRRSSALLCVARGESPPGRQAPRGGHIGHVGDQEVQARRKLHRAALCSARHVVRRCASISRCRIKQKPCCNPSASIGTTVTSSTCSALRPATVQ